MQTVLIHLRFVYILDTDKLQSLYSWSLPQTHPFVIYHAYEESIFIMNLIGLQSMLVFYFYDSKTAKGST